MGTETGVSRSGGREVLRWLVVALVVLTLVGGLGIILYRGHMGKPWWEGTRDKEFWDYLELLIVPAAIAVGVAVINWMQSWRERQTDEAQRVREQQMDDRQRWLELEVAQKQWDRERDLARQRAMDTALETYLDKMEGIVVELLPYLDDAEKGRSDIFPLARARTLTLLERLDGSRKRAVMRFLSETTMIHKLRGPIALQDADFSDAELTRMDLSDRNLSGARLTRAKLANTLLWGTDLRAANLSGAVLTGASLGLAGVPFSLPGEVDAEPAQTRLATLEMVDLSYANLDGAQGWTVEQLASAKTLEGATMPDGQTLRGDKTPNGPTFEDWIKSKKDREEDGESE